MSKNRIAEIEVPWIRLNIAGTFRRSVDPNDIQTPIRGLHQSPDGALLEIVLSAPGIEHIRTSMSADDLASEMRAAGVPVFVVTELRNPQIGQVRTIVHVEDIQRSSLRSVNPRPDNPPANHDHRSVFWLYNGQSIEVAESVGEVLTLCALAQDETDREADDV